MRAITSQHNPLVKQLKKLNRSSKARRQMGLALLEGATLLHAYMEAGFLPQAVILADDAGRKTKIRALIEERQLAGYVLPAALFSEVSGLENPDGVLSLITIPQLEQSNFAEFCIFLEGIQDPGNVGTMIRTAAAAGAKQIYLYQCADAWSPKVLRASMGAHFGVALVETNDLAQVVTLFPGMVYATVPRGHRLLYEIDLTCQVAFIFGNEGAGVSGGLQELADGRVSIPMPGEVESLNAAAAAAICCFERVRQKRAQQ